MVTRTLNNFFEDFQITSTQGGRTHTLHSLVGDTLEDSVEDIPNSGGIKKKKYSYLRFASVRYVGSIR